MDFTWLTLEHDFPGKQRKQNLICIYEDHYHTFKVQNKIVTFFLNRLVIEEESAFECLGTCTLKWERILSDSEKYAKLRDDKKILSKIFEQAARFEHTQYDTHILLGTASYLTADKLNPGKDPKL